MSRQPFVRPGFIPRKVDADMDIGNEPPPMLLSSLASSSRKTPAPISSRKTPASSRKTPGQSKTIQGTGKQVARMEYESDVPLQRKDLFRWAYYRICVHIEL